MSVIFQKNRWIDFRRIRILSHGSWWNELFNVVLIPAMVAYALARIFILRGFPELTITNFIFFSTLYLFWMGLFNTCTAINGAVESGEWSYWVLGLRRGSKTPLHYLNALLLYHALKTLLVAIVFASVIGVTLSWHGDYWAQALGGPYCLGESGLATPKSAHVPMIYYYVFQGSKLTLSFQMGAWFLGYFWGGLALSGVGGVMVGALLSTCFRKRTVALFGAVCITMLVTIFSFVALNPFTGYNETLGIEGSTVCDDSTNKAFDKLQRAALFAPLYQVGKTSEMLARVDPKLAHCWEAIVPKVYYDGHKIDDGTFNDAGYPDEDLVKAHSLLRFFQAFSYVLPQRYTFNLAHTPIPRTGYLSRGLLDDAKGCLRKEKKSRCWCVFCLNMVENNVIERPHAVGKTVVFCKGQIELCGIDAEDEHDPVVLDGYQEAFSPDVKILQQLWWSFAWREACGLFVLLGVFYLLILWRITAAKMFRQLR